MAPHKIDTFEQDGFSETKRKYYKFITSCVILMGCFVGLICGLIILDVVKPVGEALENQPGMGDFQVLSQDSIEVKKTKINLCEVNKAILIYQLKNASKGLPEDLKVLVEEGLIHPNSLIDYWDQPFVYLPNVGDQPSAYELKSIGIDGQQDTRDDIMIKLN
ncbi:MAG: type II secretion system protein GspG [bacterium]|nr:type II secretion system protein GspG [bacterium]MDO5461869.1 type II secretion system protein GspG [bacterium]